MKRKILALLLCVVLLLTACAAAPTPTAPPTTQPVEPSAPTYLQSVEVDDSIVRIGQYRAEIPDSFSVYSEDESSVILASQDLQCVVGLFAYDMSGSEEREIKDYMGQLAVTEQSSKEVNTMVADMSLKSDLWVDMGEDMNASIVVQTSFTDSWYIYRIKTNYLNEDDPEAAMSAVIDFLASFTSDGVPPRFDFVQ